MELHVLPPVSQTLMSGLLNTLFKTTSEQCSFAVSEWDNGVFLTQLECS